MGTYFFRRLLISIPELIGILMISFFMIHLVPAHPCDWILTNKLTPLIVRATRDVAMAIMDAEALSFLGFGPNQDALEWRAMIGCERKSIFHAPHQVIFPGLAIMILVFAFNLLGDGLRDALDPWQTYSDA